MQDWKTIGQVVRTTVDGKYAVFDSLKDAVFNCQKKTIDSLRYGHLAYRGELGLLYRGDEIVFYDDLGLTIPIWKVQETFYNIPLSEYEEQAKNRWWRYRGRHYYQNYDHDKHFRNGQVIGIHHCKWHHNRSAHVHTFQELTENDFAYNYDEDCKEYRVKIRGKRRKSYLPNAWDDRPFGSYDQKSWKHFREYQWK